MSAGLALSAFAIGVGYCAALWHLALGIARRRLLTLGPLPWWSLATSGATASLALALLPLDVAAGSAATLIGALVCALVDARTGYIFDALTLTMALGAALLGAASGRFPADLLAALAAGGLLGGLYVATARRGIGLGDVKLGACIALGYGLVPGVAALGSAFVVGGLYAAVLLLRGRATLASTVRFGPFIAIGAGLAFVGSLCGWLA